MAQNKKNLTAIVEAWAPTIKKITKNAINESTPERLEWMCELAHNQKMASLNEALGEVGGVSFPYQNLYNTMGIGNATPAQQAGQTAADQSSPASNGSGDKFPALLPMALQVAARTIGFDLVNTTPFAGPTGVIPFMDYVYSNGKEPYGASPSYSKATANPEFAVGGPDAGEAWKRYDMPSSFRAKMTLDASVFTTKRAAATAMKAAGRITLGGSLVVEFIDLARLSADPMFKVITKGTKSLGEIFDVEDEIIAKRDELIEVLHQRMQETTETKTLFTLRWQLV